MVLPLQENTEQSRFLMPVSIASRAEKLHHPSDSGSSRFAEFQTLEMNMLRSIVSLTLVAVSALAAADREDRGCSNATLKGDYGFILTGTSATGPPPALLQQIIGVGMVHFDGAGNFTQTDNIHGSITGFTAPDRPGRGTYSVKEDCTGVSTLLIEGQPPVERRFVVVDKGRELRTAVMSPATTMVTATARKQ
jgi:hypothetical protein